MADRLRLFVAVVLRDELAARVDGVRLGLGSSEVGRLPPHITLVAPFNAPRDDLAGLLQRLRHLAEASTPSSCLLGPIRQFARALPVAYLAVDDPTHALVGLAEAARATVRGANAQPDGSVFVPHVTVANRVAPDVADAATVALGHFRAPLEIDGFSLLARDPDAAEHRWREIADFVLGRPLVRGRGGIELVLSRTRMLDPVVAERAGGGSLAIVGAPWAITARLGDELAGAAGGDLVGPYARVTSLWVEPSLRGIGVASRLLETAERAASERGASRIEAMAHDDAVRRYLHGRGYATQPSDRTWLSKALGEPA